MIFFDPNKQKVASIAKEVLRVVTESGDSPDMVIDKIAKSYNLNDHWKQRIVEEFNIEAFLQKLQEGTQHENFQVAQPIIDECKQWVKVSQDQSIPEGKSKEMEKTASYGDIGSIPFGAFDYAHEEFGPFNNMHVSGDNFDDSEELEKIAYQKIDSAVEVFNQDLIKEAMYKISEEEEKVLGKLVKIANVSPGFTKFIVHELTKTASPSYAEDIMVNSKFKPIEILHSSIYDDVAPHEFEKLASVGELIEEIKAFIPLKKIIKKSPKKAKNLIKKIKGTPVGKLGALLAGANGVKKMVTDNSGTKVTTNIEAWAK